MPVPNGFSAKRSSRSPHESVRSWRLDELNTALVIAAPDGMKSAATSTSGMP